MKREAGIVLTAVGYSTVYDGKTHKASCTVCVTAGTTIPFFLDGSVTWTAFASFIKDVDEIPFLVKAENYVIKENLGTLTVK